MKKNLAFLTSLILLTILLCACGGTTGTYVLESDDAYSIEIRDEDTFTVHWGSNMFTGSYEKNDDGTYHFADSSEFTAADMTGTFDGSSLLVTGDIIFKNANGSVSDHSLLGMEDVCFKK